ncbi:Protein of unknown function [Pyronema omphalodes CBS 100304]|uniref:Uncharacterized protein n=1 Tax=Pyronema omphalodes (strain CBS 100304) TaxID=1076935 RepID=U4LUA5_PYROM|nr:Protein of unknown function [Pyronema omphalodes CBS 100304]
MRTITDPLSDHASAGLAEINGSSTGAKIAQHRKAHDQSTTTRGEIMYKTPLCLLPFSTSSNKQSHLLFQQQQTNQPTQPTQSTCSSPPLPPSSPSLPPLSVPPSEPAPSGARTPTPSSLTTPTALSSGSATPGDPSRLTALRDSSSPPSTTGVTTRRTPSATRTRYWSSDRLSITLWSLGALGGLEYRKHIGGYYNTL